MAHRLLTLFVFPLLLLAACGVPPQTGAPSIVTGEAEMAPRQAPPEANGAAGPTPVPTPAVVLIKANGVESTPTPAPNTEHGATSTPPPVVAPQPTAPPIKAATVARLRRVIGQMRAAPNYRLTFRVETESTPGAVNVERDDAVEVNGSRLHYVNRAADILHNGLPNGLDVLITDGAVDAHGPLPVKAAPTAGWYRVAQLPRSGVALQFLAGPVLDRLTEGVPLADLHSVGMVSMEGLTCDQFAGGSSLVLAALNNTGRLVRPGRERPVDEQVAGLTFDQTDYRLTLCSDDTIHQIELTMRSHVAAQSSNMHLLLHIWSINIPVVVPLPAAVRPLELPALVFGLPMTLTALVSNGGNMRQAPVSGTVLDQANAGEALSIVGRTADGNWFLVGNPRRVTGWISGSLLVIDPAVLSLIPAMQ